MTSTTASHRDADRRDAAHAPHCSECAHPMQPAGRGEHRYWTCRYCGETRSAA